MNIITKIKSQIHSQLILFYIKKGMIKTLKELREANKSNVIDIPKLITDINTSITKIRAEVILFSEAINFIENKYGKSTEAAELSTIFPFLDLSMVDILILYRQYLTTNNAIEKNFICRSGGHHMYEFLEDASRALGKQLNYTTDRLNNATLNDELKSLRISFYKLKKEFHVQLKELRHNVSGHKDRDIRTQLAISDSINIADFERTFMLFMKFFLALIQFKHLVNNAILKTKKV